MRNCEFQLTRLNDAIRSFDDATAIGKSIGRMYDQHGILQRLGCLVLLGGGQENLKEIDGKPRKLLLPGAQVRLLGQNKKDLAKQAQARLLFLFDDFILLMSPMPFSTPENPAHGVEEEPMLLVEEQASTSVHGEGKSKLLLKATKQTSTREFLLEFPTARERDHWLQVIPQAIEQMHQAKALKQQQMQIAIDVNKCIGTIAVEFSEWSRKEETASARLCVRLGQQDAQLAIGETAIFLLEGVVGADSLQVGRVQPLKAASNVESKVVSLGFLEFYEPDRLVPITVDMPQAEVDAYATLCIHYSPLA